MASTTTNIMKRGLAISSALSFNRFIGNAATKNIIRSLWATPKSRIVSACESKNSNKATSFNKFVKVDHRATEIPADRHAVALSTWLNFISQNDNLDVESNDAKPNAITSIRHRASSSQTTQSRSRSTLSIVKRSKHSLAAASKRHLSDVAVAIEDDLNVDVNDTYASHESQYSGIRFEQLKDLVAESTNLEDDIEINSTDPATKSRSRTDYLEHQKKWAIEAKAVALAHLLGNHIECDQNGNVKSKNIDHFR